MGISTNSIFHFTNSKDTLKSILKDGGFKITYCLEMFELDKGRLEAAIPMVSFSDIPLSKVETHLNKYGKYAIALSKKWAAKNGLNPVIYMQKQSTCAAMMEPLIIDTFNNDPYGKITIRYTLKKVDEHNHEMNDVFNGDRANKINSLIGTLSFIKNHDGDLYRNNVLKQKNYRFYDEREWRYVPMYNDFDKVHLSYDPFMHKDEYYQWRDKTKRKEFLPDLLLRFDASDIEYILTKNDAEINNTIQLLSKFKHLYSSEKEYRILISKIFSCEKIFNDI